MFYYVGTVEWLETAGMINTCYCMGDLALPLKGNYNPDNFKIYFKDTGLLIATLDDEAQNDFGETQRPSDGEITFKFSFCNFAHFPLFYYAYKRYNNMDTL